MPPAPPAEKSRVAASPASVIWYEARQSSRSRNGGEAPTAADDAREERDVGDERQQVEAQRDRDPHRVGVLRSCAAHALVSVIFGSTKYERGDDHAATTSA